MCAQKAQLYQKKQLFADNFGALCVYIKKTLEFIFEYVFDPGLILQVSMISNYCFTLEKNSISGNKKNTKIAKNHKNS